jgi:undecaprenyl-phosphate galactose phosphotransferase
LCDVVVGLDSNFLKDKVRLINFLQHNCLTVLVLPEIAGLALYGAQIEHFFGNDQLVLRLNNNLARKSNIIVKRIFDLVCVSFGIILLLPVFIVLAILVRFSGTKKIFYLHKRVGRHGEPFYCIKFQTMYSNSAELLSQLLVADPQIKAEWEQSFKLKNDPRVTPLGRWLRKTSLDELPQLFNVLIGEMSLVGPRPIINEEIARYQDGYYYYQLVLPGVSGLWQVSGRSEVDYSDRVRLDEWYVKNWSLWYDIVILIKTIGVVVKRSGAY